MLHVLIAITVVYTAACVVLYVVQKKMLYFPTGTPAVLAPVITTVNVSGATLNISTRPAIGPQAVIYFGGNAEDVSMSLPDVAQAFPRHAIFMVHYRGYGGSTGTPAESALHDDAQAIYELINRQHSRIIVIGRSLGSGIAVRLAAANPVEHLILVTPFDSIVNVAKQSLPLFPVAALLTERFESWRYAPQITVPTTIVAAEHDEVIPRERTLALYTAFVGGVAHLEIIKGAGHNNISDVPAYFDALVRSH